MTNELDVIGAKLHDALDAILHEAKANAPAVETAAEDVAAAALAAVGAPSGLSEAVRALVGGLVTHFTVEHPPAPPATETPAEPAAPAAEAKAPPAQNYV